MKYIFNFFNKIPLWLVLIFNVIVGFLSSACNMLTLFLKYGMFDSIPEPSEILTGHIARIFSLLFCIFLNFCLYKKIKKKRLINNDITKVVAIFRLLLTIFVFCFFDFSFFTFPFLLGIDIDITDGLVFYSVLSLILFFIF